MQSPTNILNKKSQRTSRLRGVVANALSMSDIVGVDALHRLCDRLDSAAFVAEGGKTYPPAKFEPCGRVLLLTPEERSQVRRVCGW